MVIGLAGWVHQLWAADPEKKPAKALILPGESFLVQDRPAFVLLPPQSKRTNPQPWIMYAPTLPGLPDEHEKWMHEQFLAAGVAVAGIDIGEAYGSPKGQELFTSLHTELVEKRGYAKKVCLLGRSRGGLWVTSWACAHPEKVAGIAGIYPVFDLRTYPGLAKAAPAYGHKLPDFEAKLADFNPIERVGVLGKAKVPVYLIHGDDDQVVPLKSNSEEFVARYKGVGGEELVTLNVAKGQGHNYWEGFFHCQELVDFAIARARADAAWVDISSPIVRKLTEAGQKTAWPGETAGVAVDPVSGDVYMIVTGQGVWKSTDTGKSFARVDGGKIGGRCETSFALNVDSKGSRLACFMLDGKCAWTGDSGQTWNAFADVGRNWDYAAVDWSAGEVKTIFAALHESGGQVMFSSDGGKTWHKLFKDAEFDKTGGLGIFDEKTLVYTQKGKGIQHSTDGGQTWTKIAERQPIGRLVNFSHGKAYWLAKEGLLVSGDRGATWNVQGKSVEASIGPYFDPQHDQRMVVAGAKGIFQTDNGGEGWKLVARLPAGFEKLPKDGWFTNVAWDPLHDTFYVSHMGKPTYRLQGTK